MDVMDEPTWYEIINRETTDEEAALRYAPLAIAEELHRIADSLEIIAGAQETMREAQSALTELEYSKGMYPG